MHGNIRTNIAYMHICMFTYTYNICVCTYVIISGLEEAKWL